MLFYTGDILNISLDNLCSQSQEGKHNEKFRNMTEHLSHTVLSKMSSGEKAQGQKSHTLYAANGVLSLTRPCSLAFSRGHHMSF